MMIQIILAIVSSIVLIGVVSTQYKEVDRLHRTTRLEAIDQRLAGTYSVMNDFPGSAGRDVLILGNFPGTLTADRQTVMEDLQRVMERSSQYLEVYIAIYQPPCVFSVPRPEESSAKPVCLSTVDPAITAARPRTTMLSVAVVYVSRLMMYRGRTVLLYGTRITRVHGGIVTVVDANYMLDEVRRLARDGETVVLVANDGSYLAHPNRSKEKLTGSTANFYDDFPTLPKSSLADTTLHRQETNDTIFTFWRMHPTASNFALYEGANKLLGKGYENDEYWTMVSVSKKSPARVLWQSQSYLIAVTMVILFHLLMIALLPMPVRKRRNV